MSRKTLKMNRFGKSILSEYELFSFKFTKVQQKYPKKSENNLDVYQASFDWSWNGYTGYGEIDFYKSSMTTCNTFGENSSNMTVDTNSKRKQSNGRNNCALYNDQALEELFNRMLQSLYLSNDMLYDDYIKSIMK